MTMVNVVTTCERSLVTLMSFEKTFLESFTVDLSVPRAISDLFGMPVYVFVKPENEEVENSTILDVLNFIVWIQTISEPSTHHRELARACIDEWRSFCASEERSCHDHCLRARGMARVAISYCTTEPAIVHTFVVPSRY